MERVDIELFLLIIEHNSITKAAEMEHFSQSTVSYRIKCMEKELGIPLFYRKKGVRTSELTKQGELFIPIARQWLELYKNTDDLQKYPFQHFSVGAISSISASILGDVYTRLTQSELPIQLRIRTAYSDVLYNLVENNSLDIAFIAEKEERKHILTIPAFSERYYVVNQSKYPRSMGKVSIHDLKLENEIYMDWNISYSEWHEKVWGNIPGYHVWVDNFSLLQKFLVQDEKYWAIVPGSLLHSIYRNMSTVQINELEDDNPPTREIYMIQNKSPRENRRDTMILFERFLKECLADMPHIQTLY